VADVFTKEKRSEVMSRIRGRGNERTELALVRLFRANRITGWRRQAMLPGRPDFVFRKEKVAVFVDGCFWHGCPKCFRQPKNNKIFWLKKLSANRHRDKRVASELRSLNWRVLRLWEHALRKNPANVVRRVRSALAAGASKR
jgi:DNA mismatch endonuclease (patch repair protein)